MSAQADAVESPATVMLHGRAVSEMVRFSTYPKNLPEDEFTTQQIHSTEVRPGIVEASAEKRSIFGVCHDELSS